MLRPALIALLLSPAAAPAAESAVVLRPDVTYAVAGPEKLQLDVAMPAAPGPHPAVVCLHGGAWRSGSRKDLSRASRWYDFGIPGKSLLEVLAARGFVAVSVGYRFAPDNKFPAQIEDAKTAVRFLRANAEKFGIDPDRIAALGFSSGGHLAALLGTADESAGFEGKLYPEQSSRVQCVVDFFGPSDLTLYTETPWIEWAYFAPLLGGRSRDHMELYKRASPIEYVSNGDPPFLIVQGTADLLVPAIHSERLHEKLTAAGVESKLVTVKGKGHGWGGEDAARTTETAIRFLSEQLLDGGK
jgi:acetyl esterase/lipase